MKRSHHQILSEQPPSHSHAPFALYGTPLPLSSDNTRDDGSFVPEWQQVVTDDRGRKRLHGAFTGGFSAGYYNTVGSKEGWAPSTFVSSKGKKDGGGVDAQQRVEDFMDAEDLAEREATQTLETVEAFAGLGGGGGGGGAAAAGGGMFAELFRASPGEETMGVKLLQRMGWRQGQGVGPRVRRRAQGDKSGEAHLFAPENSRMVSFEKKKDRRGLGFAETAGLERAGTIGVQEDDSYDDRDARMVETRTSRALLKPEKKLGSKSGMGIGVLNDTGSDDEDPYDIGPKISYGRVVGGDDNAVKKTKLKKKKAGLVSSNTSQSFGTQVKSLGIRTSTLTPSGFRKCHDGRPPLDGFVLSLAPLSLVSDTQYPAPTIPEGWISSKSNAATSATSTTTFQSTSDAAKSSTLDPKSRAALLGESVLPGKSIFDFLSPAARDRVVSGSGKSNLPQALNEKAPPGFETNTAEQARSLWDLVPALPKETAETALRKGSGRGGWLPYAEDAGKRGRYTSFLALRAGTSRELPERVPGTSIEDWARELREFAQAAEVFRPVSAVMASRFTTAASSSSSSAVMEGDAAPATLSSKKAEDPAEKAAGLGMYGPLTRVSGAWYPSRLLCKRFNVRPPAGVAPDPGGEREEGREAEQKRLEVVSEASLKRMMDASAFKGTFVSAGTEGGSEGRDERKGGGAGKMVVDAEANAALEGQRAGEAVFKAIFGSEDEEE